jgi:hypothetical protein
MLSPDFGFMTSACSFVHFGDEFSSSQLEQRIDQSNVVPADGSSVAMAFRNCESYETTYNNGVWSWTLNGYGMLTPTEYSGSQNQPECP